MVKEIIRKITFRPYRPGMGPVFRLTIWDTYRTSWGNKSVLGYRLKMFVRKDGDTKGRTIFKGEDFGCSPTHAIDSNETVRP